MNINNEKSSLNKKIVYNITKFTTTDYPNHLSCIVWFVGCNMRCSYCYNSNIVLAKEANYSFKDFLNFLKSRIGLLEAVVLSGGEASMHDLVTYCQEIKKLGFKIKLDTNGINTILIKELVEKKLLDFIALDFKAPKEKFQNITKIAKYENFYETLKYLIGINFDFEVRTTLHNDLLSVKDINNIIKHLKEVGYKKSYYIQNFLYTPDNLDKLQEPTSFFDNEKLSNELCVVFR